MKYFARELFHFFFAFLTIILAALALLILGTLADMMLRPAWSAEPIRVAVVDTGLDTTDPRFAPYLCAPGLHRDFTGAGLLDTNSHGTHVAGLVVQNGPPAGTYCLMILKYFREGAPGKANLAREIRAIRWATSHGARYVNMSGGGPEFDSQEYLAIRSARQTWFITAAGNEYSDLGASLMLYYPASYVAPNIVAVGALSANGTGRLPSSNYGGRISAWEIGENVRSWLPGGREGLMSGTSQATAVRTGKLLKAVVTGENFPR